MMLLQVAAAFAAAWVAVRFGLRRSIEKSWKAGGGAQQMARAGLLAGLKTLSTFLGVAACVYAVLGLAFAGFAQSAQGLDASQLGEMHERLKSFDSTLKSLREGLGLAALWIAILGLFLLATRLRRTAILKVLIAERDRQIDDLMAKAQADALEVLPPTPEMNRLNAEILSLTREVASHPDRSQALTGDRDKLVERYVFLDLERRVDLSSAPIIDADGRETWGRIRQLLTSKGLGETLGLASKSLSRLGIAITCALAVGVATPLVGTTGVAPLLAQLGDLRVLGKTQTAVATLKAAHAAAAAVEKHEPKPVASPDPSGKTAQAVSSQCDDRSGAGDAQSCAPSPTQVYRQVAERIFDDLAGGLAGRSGPDDPRGPDGGSSAPTRPAPHAVAAKAVLNAAVRDRILLEYAAAAPPSAHLTHFFLDDAGAVAPRFAAYRDQAVGGAVSTSHTQAVDRLAAYLEGAAAQSPKIKAKLLESAKASWTRPRPVSDYPSYLAKKSLDAAIKRALPEPGGAFVDPAFGAVRDSLGDALARYVAIKTAGVLTDLAGPLDVAAALARVRAPPPGDLLFTSAGSAHVRRHVQALRQDAIALGDAVARDAPTLSQLSWPGQRAFAEAWRAASPADASESPSQYAGRTGMYEDLFASGAPSQRRTALAKDASLDADESARARGRARSYALLDRFHLTGGVVIGRGPTGVGPDFRGLRWRKSQFDDSSLDLSLVDRNGAVIPLGRFRGGLILQAVAYSADGRQLAVTIVNAEPLSVQRVHLHPVLSDTALGCAVASVDKFVFDSDREPASFANAWGVRTRAQLAAYNAAMELQKGTPGKGVKEFERVLSALVAQGLVADRSLQSAFAFMFPRGWAAADPQTSFFAEHPERFDMGMAQTLSSCPSLPDQSDRGYINCMVSAHAKAGGLQKAAQVSGVRENAYRLTSEGLRRDFEALGSEAALSPLSFRRQLAFDDPNEDAWRYPVLGDTVQRNVAGYVAARSDKARDLQLVRQFTMLQRLFRAGLDGNLGAGFDTMDLVRLAQAARSAGGVATAVTPVWLDPASDRDVADPALTTLSKARAGILDNLAKATTLPGPDRARCTRWVEEGAPAQRLAGEGFDKACSMFNDEYRSELRRAATLVGRVGRRPLSSCVL